MFFFAGGGESIQEIRETFRLVLHSFQISWFGQEKEASDQLVQLVNNVQVARGVFQGVELSLNWLY